MELTDAGRTRLDQGAPFAIANNAAMSEKLTESEFADLKRLLGKLTQGERADLKRF